ncbi:Inorganic triphosphatase [Sinobacterium norvegicum]|uniref:Inorganic triphosphatase n=1 Tax=Sinobacterium norvegicum TaxID=1641715 RepID=A0ABM9AHC1_9GAMM|nr:CYTH domain-containing protein [Sinobacterium norvegicum]CAH0992616.1 Inorganic triphosphatase [Sinobacterium norvegicum]
MLEIERKYRVHNSDYKALATVTYRIVQGYLNSHPERTVRVRIKADRAFITVKGKSSESGLSRFEWEREIALAEAEQLLPLCEPGSIEKIRYIVPFLDQEFEVDEFLADNKGLVVAELELKSEQQQVELPAWVAKEVTGDVRYYNSSLMKQPYKQWLDQ